MADLNFHKDLRDRDAISARRRELLSDAVAFTESGSLRKGFSRDFLRYLDELSFRMVTSGEDYYALFLSRTIREIDFTLTYPASSVMRKGSVVFMFNPLSFLFLEELEARAMIKHEIYHIILKHHSREKVLKNKYQKLAISLGMDISVNQYITNLPHFAERINSVNVRFNLNLRTNETLEFYVESIHEAMMKMDRKDLDMKKENGIDIETAHDRWAESETEDEDRSRETIKAILSHAGDKGVPGEILKILETGGKGRINWQSSVRRALRTVPKGRRKTVARLDRRQPDRLDLKGELRDFAPDITVALDISGSITDKDMNGFLTEMLMLTRQHDAPIRVLECDNEVRRDYMIRSIKDIRPLLDRRGGTRFSPVFEYIKEKNLRSTFLVYFTDGEGEEHLTISPVHFRTLWVVLGSSISLKDPRGDVFILKEDREEVDRTYGLQVMRTLLHEWAR